jgi:hypothetical protein
MASDEVPTLASKRVKHMLSDLAAGPFVVVIFDGDDLRFYASGLDAEKLAVVESVVESLNTKENDGEGHEGQDQ